MVLFTVICSLSRLAIVLVLTIFVFCSDRTGGHSKLIYCPHQLKGRLKWCTLNFFSSFMCEVISKRLIGLKFSYKRKCHELTVSVCAMNWLSVWWQLKLVDVYDTLGLVLYHEVSWIVYLFYLQWLISLSKISNN